MSFNPTGYDGKKVQGDLVLKTTCNESGMTYPEITMSFANVIEYNAFYNNPFIKINSAYLEDCTLASCQSVLPPITQQNYKIWYNIIKSNSKMLLSSVNILIKFDNSASEELLDNADLTMMVYDIVVASLEGLDNPSTEIDIHIIYYNKCMKEKQTFMINVDLLLEKLNDYFKYASAYVVFTYTTSTPFALFIITESITRLSGFYRKVRTGRISFAWDSTHAIQLNDPDEKITKKFRLASDKGLNEKMLDFSGNDTADADNSSIMNMSDRLSKYKYFPSTTIELIEIIHNRIKNEGSSCDLNDIDVSEITNMDNLFRESIFNGDISKWNVSNVKYMSAMFLGSVFNGDISKWDVSNVVDMSNMFENCTFNGDISDWDVSNVKDMSSMFFSSHFNRDISEWNVSKVIDMAEMFSYSCFNGDISKWDVSNVESMQKMFAYSDFNRDISKWNVSKSAYIKDMFDGTELEKTNKLPYWYDY